MEKPVLLLVDDDSEALSAAKRVFRSEPYEVLTAGGGPEALKILSRRHVDLLISDYQMPGMTGLELFREVKRRHHSVYRVITSGYARAEEVLAASYEGEVQQFIPKPWDHAELQSTVRDLLEAAGLRERKDYLEALLKSLPTPVLIIDLAGKIVLANGPCGELLGETAESLVGRPATRLLKGGREEAAALQERLTDENIVIGHETLINTARGPVPVLVSLSIFSDLKGERLGTLVTMQDITPRKSAEADLRKTLTELATAKADIEKRAEELSVLQKLSARLSHVTDIAELLQVATPAVLSQVGGHVAALVVRTNGHLKAAAFASDKLEDDKLDEVRRKLDETIAETLTVGENCCKTLPIGMMPGPPLPSEPLEARHISDLLIPLDIPQGCEGFLWVRRYGKASFAANEEDFCKTIAVEVALILNRHLEMMKSEQQKINALVEGMPEPMVMLTESFDLLCLNPSARALLNVPESETKFDPAALKPPEVARLFKRAAHQPRKEFEDDILFVNPVPRTYRVVVAPLCRSGKKRVGTVAVFHDVTQWREAERMKTEFVANVSHELRTPLTSIKESTSLLLDEVLGKISPKQREFLSLAARECARLSRLVDDILEISRIEGARLHLNRTRASLVEAGQSVLDSLRAAAGSAEVSLALSAPRDFPPILFDVDRMTQILLNLLGNAIKFTPPGGSVRLVLENRAKSAVIRVIDTGIGIPSEETDKIFDKFHRVPSSQKQTTKGTGLGLFICKALVEMHGGSIRVKSKPGKGTEFSFTLPRVDVERALGDYLMSLIEQNRKDEKRVGILALTVKSGETGGSASLLWDRLTEAVRKAIYKAGDRIFQMENDTLVIILTEADEAGVLAVQQRLDAGIRAALGESLRGWELCWSQCSYPEDGHTPDELLLSIKERESGGGGSPGSRQR